MNEKSIHETAFEWICECGAFEQLRKQSENYAADLTVASSFYTIRSFSDKQMDLTTKEKKIIICFQGKTVYRFVLEMDLMHLLDFNGERLDIVLICNKLVSVVCQCKLIVYYAFKYFKFLA